MPTYEYICEHCGSQFERFESITARPLRTCPECGKNGPKRLIGTGAGIIFKGSGFYETDYRSESYKKAAEKEKKSQQEKTDKKDSKPESANKDAGAQSKSDSAEKKTA